ncbi:RICIN domain-containing protein [Kitasatospora sp. CB01950]|uniref:RICIN domain-containing protein n=1 Tax=Kitasatospora sp. CB01950 TaxID=1703930 RepID=UPI000939242B|nr:RICIN domain-containing protein [Kitasatospora sp. CB01950]
MRLRTAARSLAVLAGVTTLALGAVAPASAAQPTSLGTYVRFINKNSGKCLEIADWRKDNGAPARQWDCTGGANQLWEEIGDVGDHGIRYYRNVNSQQCLEIGGLNASNGATANQWPCNWGGNQIWLDRTNKLQADAAYWPAAVGKCLEIADWRTDNGAPARLWDCTNGANQGWQIV